MKKLKWCKKQKLGIKIISPSENISRAYLKKANSSLNMLSSAIEKKEIEWIASTAYYARYFAVYSLLMKIGIKCEIHDCTIYLFKEILKFKELGDEFEQSKKDRVDLQYYVTSEINLKEIVLNSKKAFNFVLKLKEIIENFKEVEQIREMLN